MKQQKTTKTDAIRCLQDFCFCFQISLSLEENREAFLQSR